MHAPQDSAAYEMRQILYETPQRAKKSAREYMRDFVREAAKSIFLISMLAIGYLVSPEIFSEPQIVQFLAASIIFIMGVAVLFLWWFFGRSTQEWQGYFEAMCQKSQEIVNTMNTDYQIQLRRQQARIRALESQTAAGILEFAIPSGRPTHVNETFVELFGFTLTELQTVWDKGGTDALIHTAFLFDDQAFFEKQFSQRLAGNADLPWEFEAWVKRRNGTTLPIQVSIIPIKENGTHVLQYHLRDIQREKDADNTIQALTQFNEHLMAHVVPEQHDRQQLAKFYDELKGDTKDEFCEWP